MESTPAPGKCQTIVQRKVTRGILAKGTESFGTRPAWCRLNALPNGSFCKAHQAAADELQRKLIAKRAKDAAR